MKVLICGLGSIGKRHLENLRSLGFTADDIIIYRSGKGLKEFGDNTLVEHKHAYKVFNNLGKALAEKPDIAIIANPTSIHIKTAIETAKAGCHLFIEKPISHNTNGIKELLELADNRGLTIYVGYSFRQHPHMKQIKQMLDEKILGDIFYARFTTGEFLPDWHPWEDYRGGYAARKDLGGGVLLTQSHDLDTAMWFFDKPVKGSGFLKTSGHLEVAVDDNTDIVAEFEKCPRVSFHLDYLTRPPLKRCEIFGTMGHIEWNATHAKTTLSVFLPDEKTKFYELPHSFERNTMYIDELKEFINCIENKKTPPTNGWAGYKILSFIERLSDTK